MVVKKTLKSRRTIGIFIVVFNTLPHLTEKIMNIKILSEENKVTVSTIKKDKLTVNISTNCRFKLYRLIRRDSAPDLKLTIISTLRSLKYVQA